MKILLNTRKNKCNELPSFIWDRNIKNIDVSLEWSILDKVKPYLLNHKAIPSSRNCMLCLTTKYHI